MFQKYEEWKNGLPDFKWVDEYLPDTQRWNNFTTSLSSIRDSVRDSIDIGKYSLFGCLVEHVRVHNSQGVD